MNAATAIRKVIIAEGGSKITDDPSDSGGLTKYGISQKSYPGVNIRALTEADAIAIYKRDYWDRLMGDKLPYNIAYALFNQSVVRGVGAAVKTAQKVAGVPEDGGMGPVTLGRIISMGEKAFLEKFLALSKQAAIDLAAARPKDQRFLQGWLNRIDHISDYVGVKPATLAVSAGLILMTGFFLIIFLTSSKTMRTA